MGGSGAESPRSLRAAGLTNAGLADTLVRPDGQGDRDRAVPASEATLTLVVPLFNETDRFASVSDQLAEFVAAQPPGSELIFVDDGSDDGTPDIVEAFISSRPTVIARLVRRP